MAIVTKYVIRDATNDLYYNEDHLVPLSDRWTPIFSNAFLFDSIIDAENEIENEEYSNSKFFIQPITIKQ